MIEQSISVERLEETVNLFGSMDENVKLIERDLDVTVVNRDGVLKIAGEDGEKVIFAVKALKGLLKLIARGENITEQNVRYIVQLIREGKAEPAFIIGAPVGFVNVIEAKELIRTAGIPCIIARGRKGGSNIAAAICNAIVKLQTAEVK